MLYLLRSFSLRDMRTGQFGCLEGARLDRCIDIHAFCHSAAGQCSEGIKGQINRVAKCLKELEALMQ